MNPQTSPALNPQPAKTRRWLRALALASVISAFALIILGGIVRVTGSGMGCGGDWPLCDGQLLPAATSEDIIEWSHRWVAAAIVGPLIIATAIVAWLAFRRDRWLTLSAAAAVILLLLQGGLGGITVLTELPGAIVAAHLALAQALLGCLILILVAAYRRPTPTPTTAAPTDPAAAAAPVNPAPPATRPAAAQPPHPPSPPAPPPTHYPRLTALSAAAAYLLILSGALVTATPGALAACPEWPLCNGWTLPFDHLPAVNMFHRLVAALLGILLLYTLHLGLRRPDPSRAAADPGHNPTTAPVIRRLSLAGIILFTAQFLVGGLAVWTQFPVELRALHIALATAVWAIMIALALLTYRPLTNPAARPPSTAAARVPQG